MEWVCTGYLFLMGLILFIVVVFFTTRLLCIGCKDYPKKEKKVVPTQEVEEGDGFID